MISSRVSDTVPFSDGDVSLADLRGEIKKEIEAVELLGAKVFECWINEDAPPAAGDNDSWATCLNEIHRADLVLFLYNGRAGWAKPGGTVGICHAEFAEAMSSGAGKVRPVALPWPTDPASDQQQADRDAAFQEHVGRLNLFRGGTVTTIEDARNRAREAVHAGVVALARAGVRSARGGKYDTGDALDWSLLNFNERQAAMTETVAGALKARGADLLHPNALSVRVSGRDIVFRIHAIPAATSVAAARELVGRPFLLDYLDADLLKSVAGGPVHLIACHRGVTETQAIAMLGFPDATVVSSAFGVYVADSVQKIQLVFLANCRDQTSTRHGVQQFMEWLDTSGESNRLMQRAASRRKIAQAVAKEQ